MKMKGVLSLSCCGSCITSSTNFPCMLYFSFLLDLLETFETTVASRFGLVYSFPNDLEADKKHLRFEKLNRD